jgi:RNA polymerase sigma-B factor
MPDRRLPAAERPTDAQERAVLDAANLERFKQWRASGDTALRDQLVVEHHWIAARAARRFAERGEPYDDLYQVASLGLFKAVERFDPEVGSNFLAFAMPTVVGEIRRHFRDHTWSVRVPRRAKDLKGALTAAVNDLSQDLGRAPNVDEIAERLQVDAETVLETMEASAAYRTSSLDLPAGEQPSALQTALASNDVDLRSMVDRAAIGQLLAELPARERRILYLRFFEQMSQAEIAAQVGTSQVHVGRLLHASLAKLRAHLDPDDLA